jgi:hypothetical protein
MVALPPSVRSSAGGVHPKSATQVHHAMLFRLTAHSCRAGGDLPLDDRKLALACPPDLGATTEGA